jgi:mycoredoxin-dependent peroxiredoxin
MRKLSLAAFALCAASTLFGQAVQPPHTTLKVGDMAPDFTLRSTQRTTVKLSDFRGKNTVVLAFYPAAFTGGWTAEFKAYQSGIAKFDESGAKVFGISTDNTPSQQEFAAKNGITVPFLSDFAKRDVSRAYGVLNENAGVANRATFVIDKEGKIIHIDENQAALDPTGANDACSRSAHKAGQ